MILCCGEALIDMIPAECAGGAMGFVPHPGGSVFNTAIALGRLDARVGMFTGLSSDFLGQRLAQSLRESQVDTSYGVISERPTPLAFVQLSEGQASYTFYDENSALRMLTSQDLPQLSDEVEALFFGGISLCRAPVAGTLQELCAANASRRVILLDPNIRPGFIEDEAEYRSRLQAMIACADVIKVSDEDLNWIFPERGTLDEKCAALMELGPSITILTRGRFGASAWSRSGAYARVNVPSVEVVDTVGAGDTFNAGVIARLCAQGIMNKDALRQISGETLHDALTFGAQVAAVTVSRAGANPPWQRDLL